MKLNFATQRENLIFLVFPLSERRKSAKRRKQKQKFVTIKECCGESLGGRNLHFVAMEILLLVLIRDVFL